ncbi:phosphoglucosamine mutase [Metallumcola ferriviriculae]|uniref:Phosphoglucosamine mutase n=1 Tax=Metallumcola ferriviriculae TaxID=3039180 RepID=A0AAU0UIY3_9FIRM|nr:phosphoglucosamine mutase [Desulfitibacteraceae bacterium MK1]
MRLFGTDGVRGVANEELTPELAFKLGQAGARVLGKGKEKPKIVIGKDTRISGDMLEAALVAGICSVGSDALLVGIVPTPAVSYLTRELGADAGVVISASHNPVADNGIKFFGSQGFKLDDDVEDDIEREAAKVEDSGRPVGENVGRAVRVMDAEKRYINFLKGTIRTDLKGIKVVVDCANGAASGASPKALWELGADVIPIFNDPDGVNINKDCGSTHIEALQQAVLAHGADIGLAHDGDADRVLAVDEKGRLVDGDQIMVILAKDLMEKGQLRKDTLVVTVMSNLGLHLALKENGIKTPQTKVGDRYVLEKMREIDATLGGEQSGHIIFLDHNTTGDGVLTGLQLMQVVKETGKSLSVLAGLMQRLPQVLVNVRVKDKQESMTHPTVTAAIAGAEESLGGKGRILVRPSGTEPLLRIMGEGTDEAEIKQIVESIAQVVRENV